MEAELKESEQNSNESIIGICYEDHGIVVLRSVWSIFTR